jgi:hypothetical protein
MLSATVKITGISPLLQNNPQTVDRFNPYTKKMATINAKKTRRTDDDYRELHDIEIRSKIYFDESLGIYVPATWVTASIEATAFKVAKISKADIRGALFAAEDKIKLAYRDSSKVKEPLDIVKNGDFRINLTLKQGQPRIVKAFPIFHEWSFETTLEFDDKIIDPDSLTRIIQHVARYGGFGDFRPKFGRANADVKHG